MSDLKIIYSNINSYIGKKSQVNHYIQNHDISCALFVETKTRRESPTSYQDWSVIHHPGNVVNTNLRGGSIIQMHPRLKLGKSNPPSINSPLNDCLHVTTPFRDEQLHIFLVYIHPTSLIEETILTKAVLYRYSLIIGDFNVNSSQKKRQLNRFLNSTNFEKYDTGPTFIMPNNNDSTPDLILYSDNLINSIKKVKLTPDLGADHLGIQIDLDTQSNTAIYDPGTIRYKFHKCKVEEVNRKMEDYLENNPEMSEIHINELNNSLSEIILENTPKQEGRFYKYELPPFILKQIKRKRRMYREYQRDKNPDSKKHINQLNKDINKMIKQFNSHRWTEACNEINVSHGKKFYETINKMTKYKRKTTLGTLVENGQQVCNDEERAKVFMKHFEKCFTPEDNVRYDKENKERVDRWYCEYFKKNKTAISFQIQEDTYYEILMKQKNTSPGHDNIHWSIFKRLSPKVHDHIIKIYNYCLNNGLFPQTWKTGNIIVIHKPNTDSSKAANYRPITLLPVIGKLFEKIIKKLLSDAIATCIPKHQYGFKERHSTIHPLTILISNIEATRLNNNQTAALFLDINKAFDSVWHRGLLYKLAKLETPEYLIHIVKEFIEDRILRIKINSTYSDEFIPLQGVPQGSPLSPLLYNIYCHDIFYHSSPNSYVLQYADDTALVSHENTKEKAIEKLQNMTEQIEDWFQKWRLKQNPTKSQLIIFYHTPKPTSPSISISNENIKPLVSVKYLGVQIDNRINFKNHITITKNRVISRAKYFRSLTYKSAGINHKTASKIYKAICRPLLEYAHTAFMNVRKEVKKKLQTAETTALRSITKMRHPRNPIHNPPNALLYNKTGIKPILDRLEDLGKKFAKQAHNMAIINGMTITRTSVHSKYKHPKETIIEKLRKLSEEDEAGR